MSTVTEEINLSCSDSLFSPDHRSCCPQVSCWPPRSSGRSRGATAWRWRSSRRWWRHRPRWRRESPGSRCWWWCGSAPAPPCPRSAASPSPREARLCGSWNQHLKYISFCWISLFIIYQRMGHTYRSYVVSTEVVVCKSHQQGTFTNTRVTWRRKIPS